MALNSIIPINTKIQEVDQCEPISSPSSSLLDIHKTVPNIFSKYKFNENYFINNEKSKTISPKRKYKNIFDRNNFKLNDSFENNLNIEKEKKILDKYSKKTKNYNIKNDTSSTNYFSLKKNLKTDDIDENIDKNIINSKIKKNFTKNNDYNNNNIIQNNLYSIYSNNIKARKSKEKINSLSEFDDLNKFENQIISINREENDTSLFKRKIPKMELNFDKKEKKEKNENTKNIYYNNTYNDSFRYSNPNSAKIGVYQRKKILDGKTYNKLGKNESNMNITTESSIKRDSIKSDFYIERKNNKIINNDQKNKNKKRPLTLNINIGKKNLEKMNIGQIRKIMKDDGFFYVLRFLGYKDIICLFKARNKQLCTLINTALINAYFFSMRESLIKYSNIFEILKYTLVLSKIKDALKIDFVINFRFVNKKNEIYSNQKIKLGPNNNFKDPVYCQICYIYSYYLKKKNKKEFITKEEYEKQIKQAKLYDYYTFDLYPSDKYKNNFYPKNSSPIYISKELSLFEKDGNNNIVNIQPILPFTLNDKGIINLELYTTNNGFIDPNSIKILVKVFNLKNYLATLSQKNISNPRISECEEICLHWKNINLYQQHKSLIFRINKLFEPFFDIKKIYFGNIGVNIFKVELLAIKAGEINDKNKIEIKIKIKEKDDYVENEIRKNNLLFERRDIFEIRVGESLLYYFSLK